MSRIAVNPHAFGNIVPKEPRMTVQVDWHARLYQRSAYDASNLELAKRRILPFATRDEPLKKAAEELGIPIFQP